MNQQNLLDEDKLKIAFKMFDKDGGGTICTHELKELFSYGGELPEELMNEIIS